MKITGYKLLKEDLTSNLIGSDQKVSDISKSLSNIGGGTSIASITNDEKTIFTGKNWIKIELVNQVTSDLYGGRFSFYYSKDEIRFFPDNMNISYLIQLLEGYSNEDIVIGKKYPVRVFQVPKDEKRIETKNMTSYKDIIFIEIKKV